MADQTSLLRAFSGPFADVPPGTGGLDDCESLFTHLRNKETAAGKYLVRHFLGTQRPLGSTELGNVYCLPVTENPARGLTKVMRDMIPLLR